LLEGIACAGILAADRAVVDYGTDAIAADARAVTASDLSAEVIRYGHVVVCRDAMTGAADRAVVVDDHAKIATDIDRIAGADRTSAGGGAQIVRTFGIDYAIADDRAVIGNCRIAAGTNRVIRICANDRRRIGGRTIFNKAGGRRCANAARINRLAALGAACVFLPDGALIIDLYHDVRLIGADHITASGGYSRARCVIQNQFDPVTSHINRAAGACLFDRS